MDFYKAVADNSSKLNDLEETILRRLIASKQSISEISVKELANEFYTAPNTITRLCHKLGFSGFVDLRTSQALPQQDIRQKILRLTSKYAKPKRLFTWNTFPPFPKHWLTLTMLSFLHRDCRLCLVKTCAESFYF